MPNARIGLWGVSGRGQRFVKFSPHLARNLVWVGDKDETLAGSPLDGTKLHIADPGTLGEANLDILVIGARGDFVDKIIEVAQPSLKPGAIILSMRGRQA